jgi:hypothetical protein
MMALIQVLPAQSLLVAGAGPGGAPQVNVYDGETKQLLKQFDAFDPGFKGGVNVAVGDVNGDGVSDIIVAAGAGGGPEVKVFSGKDYSLLYDFFAFDPSFTRGVNVAAGDINGDTQDDIICGAGAGGGPNVRVFSGADGSMLANFFAYDPSFSGGVNVASGDLLGNGRFEIITGAGAGGGPQVNVFDGNANLMSSFMAYETGFSGGVYVSTGRVRGIGFDSLITGAGAGGGPVVKAFQAPEMHMMQDGAMMSASTPGSTPPLTFSQIDSFFAFEPSFTGGVKVATLNRSPGGTNFVAGAGKGGGPRLTTFDGVTQATLSDFLTLDPAFIGGLSVAAN